MLLTACVGCSEEAVLVFVVGELVDGCGGFGVEELDLGFEVPDATVCVVGGE